MRQIPNILSALRIVMVGVFIWLFTKGRYLSALAVYVLAFLTDILDGQLARRHGWITDVGKLLDPLADKMMVIAALVCIYLGKRSPVYLVLFILVGMKELLMLVGGIFMVRRKVVAFSDWFGKIPTGLFAVGIFLSMLSFVFKQIEPYNLYVLIAATVSSYVALIHYGCVQLPRAFGREQRVEKA